MTSGILIFLIVIFYVAFSYSLKKLCRNLEVKEAWAAWTPFHPFLIYKAGDQSEWWFIVLFIPYVQLIALVVLVIAWVKIFQKSNWRLAIVPVISFPLMIATTFALILSFFTSSAPYKISVDLVRQSPAAIEILGEPISTGWVTGNLQTSNDSGAACLIIPVSGSKAKGGVYVDAIQQSGEWKFRLIAIAIEGRNEPIVLVAPPSNYSGSLCF